jgi:ABC-2 type transport system ATP-binding protein
MSSVEEICDHITLINASRNILSGSVEEIRRRAGGNNFEVIHRAEDATFEEALAGLAVVLGEGRGIVGGYRATKIHIPDDQNIRSVIARINDSCSLRSLQEIVPSMNDIFIRAVNGSL